MLRHLPQVGSLESDREGSYCLVTLVRLLDSLHTYEFIGLDLTCTDVSIRSIEVGAIVVDVGEGEGASLGVGVDVRQIQREAGVMRKPAPSE